MLAVALERGDVQGALGQASELLDDSLQPLPAAIAEALSEAVERAIEVARPLGYA